MEKQELVGVWQLQKYEITYPGGKTTRWGKNAHGFLIYTAEGYMSAALNRDPEDDTNSYRQAVRSMLFYAGTYHLEGDYVTHHVLNASLRSRIGNHEVRKITWNGKIMILSANGESGSANIFWQKLPNP